jgi:hypothetical protein
MKTRFPLLALAFLAVLLVVFAARAAVSWVGSIIMSAPSTNNSTLYLGNSGIFYENSSGNAVFQILTTTFLVTNHGNVYDLGGLVVNPASGYQFTAGGNLASADLNVATPSGIANKYAVQVNVGVNDDFNVQPPLVFANGVRLRSANDADNALEGMEFAGTGFDFNGPIYDVTGSFAANTSTSFLVLSNSATPTSGNQAYSPALWLWGGSAGSVGGTGPVGFGFTVIPIAGVFSGGAGFLVISNSYNGSVPSQVLYLDSSGDLAIPGGFSAANLTNTGVKSATSLATDSNGKIIAGSGTSTAGTTNSGIIWLFTTQTDSHYTNLGVNCATPAGVITNSPLPFRTILTNSILVANPSNALDGLNISFEFIEPNTGQCQVVWGTAFNTTNLNQQSWAIDTNGNHRTFCTFRYNGGTNQLGNPITNWTMLGVSYGN